MNFVSLFAGIGGMDLGLERAGMTCIAQVEIDEWCQRVLTKHWPNVPKYGDIRDVGKQNLPSADLVAGGFPCQPHSVAGQRRGAADDRNLWPEYLRVIKELQPRWVIGENVPGIITTYLDTVLSDLESAGYEVATFNLPACGFNAPHKRQRVFIVAYRQSDGRQQGKPYKRWSFEGATQRKKQGFGNGCSIVAHTEGIRRKWTPDTTRETGGARVKSASRWPTEPAVGRVAHGLSSALDGTLRRFGYENGNDKEAFAKIDKFRGEVLRIMRDDGREIESTPYKPRRKIGDDTLYEVSHLRTHERWNVGERIKKDKGLCDMWEVFCSEPLEKTQDVQQEMLERIRTQERNEKVGSSRVDRLRGLGNAVVPQVAEYLGNMIMNVESQIKQRQTHHKDNNEQ